jgi:hypothetical protein
MILNNFNYKYFFSNFQILDFSELEDQNTELCLIQLPKEVIYL